MLGLLGRFSASGLRGLLVLQGVVAASGGDLERGRVLYSQVCFHCHGQELAGGQGPALNDSYWQHGSSPEAILSVIDKGIPGSPMIAYESVFPEPDRIALRDFILSEQEGLRESVLTVYPREPFRGRRFTPELFDAAASLSQSPLPENHYYMERNADGVMRGTSRLHIREAGTYRFSIRPIGRTSIFLNGKEVHYSDERAASESEVNDPIELQAGIHDLEIFHEERKFPSYRFHGVLRREGGGANIALSGRGLQGNIPKIITARPGEALVVRKWIAGMPPRTLLCLLPNGVIVAWDPVDGHVLQAWHSAAINQTPSLPDRSAKPSEIDGILIESPAAGLPATQPVRFLRYETEGEKALIVSRVGGIETTAVIEPVGTRSFRLSLH